MKETALVTGCSSGMGMHAAVALAAAGVRWSRPCTEAALAPDDRFRWQTSEGATAFVAMSLADVDGARVRDATGTRAEL